MKEPQKERDEIRETRKGEGAMNGEKKSIRGCNERSIQGKIMWPRERENLRRDYLSMHRNTTMMFGHGMVMTKENHIVLVQYMVPPLIGEGGHGRTPLYRPRGIISGFEIVLHCVILPSFPPSDRASRLYLRE